MLVLHGIFHNCVGGLLGVRELFPDLKDVTVLMIQRDERSFVPPYDGIGANEYIVDVTHEVPGPDGRLRSLRAP